MYCTYALAAVCSGVRGGGENSQPPRAVVCVCGWGKGKQPQVCACFEPRLKKCFCGEEIFEIWGAHLFCTCGSTGKRHVHLPGSKRKSCRRVRACERGGRVGVLVKMRWGRGRGENEKQSALSTRRGEKGFV